MATATKNVNASWFKSWYTASSEWRDTGNGGVWVYSRVPNNPSNAYLVAQAVFPGASIGSAQITDAAFNFKVKYPPYDNGYFDINFRVALSNQSDLFHTDITSNYMLTNSYTYYPDTVYSLSINNIMSNVDFNSTVYLYIIINQPSESTNHPVDITFYNLASYQTYIALSYEVTSCSAPTSISVSNSTPPPSTNVTLSWSGASGGTNNAIVGYDIYRSTSSGGTYTLLDSVTTTNTSGSLVVTSPATAGSSYYYKIITKGSAGSSYYSNLSGYVGLTSTATACSHPTSISVSDSTPDISSSVTLSWSGASGGTNNAITGYKIYRATSSGGTYSELTTNERDVSTSSSSGSHSITSPATYGNSYFYKIKTIGTISGYDSGLSSYTYITSTATTACSAPTIISASTTNPEPNSAVTISWNSGSSGSKNTITGYLLYRDTQSGGAYSVLVSETTSEVLSAVVYSNAVDGQPYFYKVKTKGSAGASYYSSLSTVYSQITSVGNSTYCTSPSLVTLSNEFPSPLSSITLSWSGAASGSVNPITGYKIYEDVSSGGSFNTLTATISTTDTYGSLSGIIAPSTYNTEKFYKIKTIGTISGYDSILSSSAHYKTCLYANYGITIPSIATLPYGIKYIVIYYDSTNVYKVSDNSVLGTVSKETILECSGVYNNGSTHYYIITNNSVSAYITSDKARSLTESEQIYYLTNGNTRSDVLIKQWTGTDWTTNVSSNSESWAQDASSEIVQTADEISLKVSKGSIISEINQTAEQVSISASKIALEGLITANGNFKVYSDGSVETINGKFGGSLTAEETYCNNLLLNSGKEMTVGLWKIGASGMYYPSGQGFNYLAFLYNGYNAYITAQAPMYLGPDQSHPLYISGNGVTFTITNNNYSAGFIQDYYMSGGSQVLYQEICLVCNQGGDTYETAKGNLGTQTHRWDVLWVDTAHYNTHPSDSSILVKHDVVDLRNVGEIIDNVRTVEFKYNNDSADRTRFGLIYEELVKLLPEVCRKDDKTGELGIEYDDFIAILLKQAQESRKKEKELENKISSLEERLEKLEKLLDK